MSLGKVPDPTYVYRYHTSPIQCSRFVGSDQNYIISGAQNGDLCYWNNKTHKIMSLKNNVHKYGLISVDRINTSMMLSHGRDGIVYIYDTSRGLNETTNTIYTGDMTYVSCRGIHDNTMNSDYSQLISAASLTKGNMAAWDIRSPKSCAIDFCMNITKEGMILSSQLFSSISSHPYILISVSDAGNLIIHDLRNSSEYYIQTHICDTTLTSIDYNDITNTGFCAGVSESLYSFSINWDTSSVDIKQTHILPSKGISCICIRPDHKILATAGWDSKVRLFQTKNLKPLAILNNHSDQVTCVDFNSSNDLISSSHDAKIFLWDLYK